MKLRWTERATDQLVGVHDYIAQSSPEFAAAVAERIFARPEPQLIDFPYSGSVVLEYGREDIREMFLTLIGLYTKYYRARFAYWQ